MLQQTLIWTIVCLSAVGLCLRRPALGRVVLGGFFIVMAIGVNVVFVLVAPDGFVKLGTDAPLVPLYQWVFEHVVASAPALFGLLVAAFEITVGLLMIKGGKADGLGPDRRHRLPSGNRATWPLDAAQSDHGGGARWHSMAGRGSPNACQACHIRTRGAELARAPRLPSRRLRRDRRL